MTSSRLYVEVPDEPAASLRASVGPHRFVLIVVGVLLGMLLAAVDQTVVGTAMPRILADLGGLEHYAWLFTSYMLASTVTVPICGTLSDLYGRRPFFLGGMGLFLLGSVLSGLSQNMMQLILFRAVQGLGAGVLLPIIQAIIGDLFPPAERGKWQGLLMSLFGLATIIGPVAGGWITDNWGWRWVFYVNLPIGAVALLTAGLALPGQRWRRPLRLDYAGAVTLAAGTIPLLLACSWGGTLYAWNSVQILGLLALSLVMAVTFLIIEQRAIEPIIAPRLFRNRVFTVSAVTTFLIHGGMYAVIMFLPLFVQGVLGESAVGSGSILTPLLLAYIAGSILSGQIMARTGRYKGLLLGGLAVAVAGMALLARAPIEIAPSRLVRTMIVIGLGIGTSSSLLIVVVQNAFPSNQLGQVTASWQFFRSVGSTIGVALLGSLMTHRFLTGLRASLPVAARDALAPLQSDGALDLRALLSAEATSRLQKQLAGLSTEGQGLFEQVVEALQWSLGTAISAVFTVGAVALIMAFAVTLLLPELPLRHDPTSPLPPAPPGGEREEAPLPTEELEPLLPN